MDSSVGTVCDDMPRGGLQGGRGAEPKNLVSIPPSGYSTAVSQKPHTEELDVNFGERRSRAALGLGEQSNILHAQAPAAHGYSSRANSSTEQNQHLQESRPVAPGAKSSTISVVTLKGETTAFFCFSPFSKVAEAPKINAKSSEFRTKLGERLNQKLKIHWQNGNNSSKPEKRELGKEELNDRIFEVEANPEEMFENIFNIDRKKNTKVGYVPKEGLHVRYDTFGNPIFANAPNRRAPPLNTLTTKLLQETDKNDDLYKLMYNDIKIPSTMSWDQIQGYVDDKAEENYQKLKQIFFPNLTPYDSSSSHIQNDVGDKDDKTQIVHENTNTKTEEKQDVLNLKSEIRQQGNVKITGFSQNKMKRQMSKINRSGIIPPPPPAKQGEEEIIPPPPPPFKEECAKVCCSNIGKTTSVPTQGSSNDVILGMSATEVVKIAAEDLAGDQYI